jgi:hypothetical protein
MCNQATPSRLIVPDFAALAKDAIVPHLWFKRSILAGYVALPVDLR